MSVLQDLPSVWIGVKNLSPEAEPFGLSATEVMTSAERALASTEAQVFERDQPGIPELRVSVRLAKVRGKSHLFAIELELIEMVKPERELTSLETVPATTWQRTSYGIANDPESVLSAVSSLAKRFAEELVRENQ